jgi:hypothetical protein
MHRIELPQITNSMRSGLPNHIIDYGLFNAKVLASSTTQSNTFLAQACAFNRMGIENNPT